MRGRKRHRKKEIKKIVAAVKKLSLATREEMAIFLKSWIEKEEESVQELKQPLSSPESPEN